MASTGVTVTVTADNGGEFDRAKETPSIETVAVSESRGASVEECDKKKDGDISKGIVSSSGVSSGDKSSVNDIQKKIRRAERFGLPVHLTEVEKRNSRAERFGATNVVSNSETTKKAEELKRKARAERFGLPVSSASTDEEAKKKARVARFGTNTKVDSAEEEKRKARALRFSKPLSNSSSDASEKPSICNEASVS